MSLLKSYSDSKKNSPSRFFLKFGNSSHSAPNSPRLSPGRRSSFVATPRDMMSCFWCKHEFAQTDDKFLAVKCDCQPSMFFCSKLCHRSHWIDPSVGRCTHIVFKNIHSPIEWISPYIHNKDQDTLNFPISCVALMKIMSEINAFKEDIVMNDLIKTIANINFVSHHNIGIVPISTKKFNLVFVDKSYLNFGEYNLFLQNISQYLRDLSIPKIITKKLIDLQNIKIQN